MKILLICECTKQKDTITDYFGFIKIQIIWLGAFSKKRLSNVRSDYDAVIATNQSIRKNGRAMIETVREATGCPVFVFGEAEDGALEEVSVLRMGADGYFTTAIPSILVLERLAAISRRIAALRASAGTNDAAIIERGPLKLDCACRQAYWRGRNITLTKTEFNILKALVYHPKHVVGREYLMDVAYGEQIYVYDRAIDAHIKRIRAKFKSTDPEFEAIESVYGVGYRFAVNNCEMKPSRRTSDVSAACPHEVVRFQS